MLCLPARCEHGAVLEGGASTGREVAHLAYPPRGHGVTAVTNPAPFTEQGAPQDPRQDLTSGLVGDRNVMKPRTGSPRSSAHVGAWA